MVQILPLTNCDTPEELQKLRRYLHHLSANYHNHFHIHMYPLSVLSKPNNVFWRFLFAIAIYIIVWVVVGVSVGATVNTQLKGAPYLSEKRGIALLQVARVFCALSWFLDGIILIGFTVIPSIRKRDSSFIIGLISADFCNQIGQFGSTFNQTPDYCTAFGLINIYFGMCSNLWIFVIAFYLYHRVHLNVSNEEFNNTKIAFWIFAYGAPIIPALCAVSLGFIGSVGAWCWVGGEYPAFRLFYFYIPMVESFMACTFSFIQIIRTIRAVKNNPESQLNTSAPFRLTLFLIVFCFFNFWGLAFRISNIVDPNHFIFWLLCIHHSERSLAGAWDAIIFGYAFWNEFIKVVGLSSGEEVELRTSVSRISAKTRESGQA